MSNSTDFKITSYGDWVITGDGNTVSNNIPEPFTSSWLSLDDIQSTYNAASEGGVIDLENKRYAILYDEHKVPSTSGDGSPTFNVSLNGSKTVTFRNGIFSGARILGDNSWTQDTGDLYNTGFIFENAAGDRDQEVVDPMAYLVSPNSPTPPLLATWPSSQGTAREQCPRTVNPETWFNIYEDGGSNNNTVLTFNATNVLTGVQITDSALKAELTAKFAAITSGDDAIGIDDLFLFAWCDANRVFDFRVKDWDAATGILNFRKPDGSDITSGATFGTYLKIAFVGHKSFITANNEYTPDYTNSKIHYRASDEAYREGVGYQSTVWIFRCSPGDQSGSITFENCEFSAAQTILSHSSDTVADVTMDSCKFEAFNDGIGTCTGGVSECTFNYWYGLSISNLTYVTGGNDLVVEKCRFGPDCELRSGIIFLGPPSSDTSMTMGTAICRDNYFELPWSTHGNGVAVYQNSWNNTTIEHNIFVNCARGLSFQPDGGNQNFGVFTFQNNLMVLTEDYEFDVAQPGIAFNGEADTTILWNAGEQKVNFFSNSCIVPANLVTDLTTGIGVTGATINKLRQSDVRIANNVFSGVNVADGSPAVEHKRANNLQWDVNGRFPQGWASTDLPDPVSTYSYLKSGTDFEIGPTYEDQATDAGTIGIRWGSIPSLADLNSISDGTLSNWWTTFPANSVPVPAIGDYAEAVGGDQRL